MFYDASAEDIESESFLFMCQDKITNYIVKILTINSFYDIHCLIHGNFTLPLDH